MSGLLAGALASGVGAAAGRASNIAEGFIEDERKLDVQSQLMKLEEEKQLRIDEAKTNLKYRDDVTRSDPNGALNNNARANSALNTKQDATNLIDKTNTPGYLDSVASDARAKHVDGVGAVATANLANFELDSKRLVSGLQKELSETSDPAQRSAITQKIRDLTPNSKGGYADVASVGNGLRLLAKEIRKDAENATTPEEREEMLTKAKTYEQQAVDTFSSVADRRLNKSAPVADTSKPAPRAGTSAPGTSAKPWERTYGTPGTD